MRFKQTAIALSLTTLGLFFGNASAEAFTFKGHYSEAEFEALGIEIPWAAESRIGLVGTGEHEINIHDATNSSQNRVQANYDNWVSGQAVDFSLIFDSIAQTLTYTVGGLEISKSNIGISNFSDLLIRTTARVNGSSMVVDNLFLTDSVMSGAIAANSSAACSGGVGCSYWDSEYLHIGNIVGSFTLTGQSTMTWLSGQKPTRSQLAYQIKLVEGEGDVTVPEPAAISLFSLGLLGLLAKRKQ
ncbi:choice-of-anchor W domain-containing protein [Spirulina subsalsa]|uniref:choice-of-anchor W domain-containing protein n=1 Tax=Spirulina subsalsa TaxID=54311 RepID=UPI0002EF2CE0|nr:choice-of-anchor W domain-containing protein [Spirulina subsalsa]